MTVTRIYAVTPTNQTGNVLPRLVEAATQAQALRHVTRSAYDVEVADQKTLVKATSDGVKVEVASAE